jgi:hypothetical protein
MSQPDQASPTVDCLLTTICGFLLPFFLVGAGGNLAAARAAVLELIDAYSPNTPTELDLVGRIIGFSTAAMDNLRLSMSEGLSDTKVLRYRSNAVSLSRAAEQVRLILRAIQEKREIACKIPRPTVAAAPNPSPPAPRPELPRIGGPVIPSAAANVLPMDIEAMKRDARVMMAAFSKQDARATTAIAAIPNPTAFVKSAATAAIAAARRA